MVVIAFFFVVNWQDFPDLATSDLPGIVKQLSARVIGVTVYNKIMQTPYSKIWTRVTESISYDDKFYANSVPLSTPNPSSLRCIVK